MSFTKAETPSAWEELDLEGIQGVLPSDRDLTQNIGCVGKSQIKPSDKGAKD
ncbi:hypothetical protein [Algoriphagus sediminis]|uniref:hypothetical protein n=1 Tax=Algoriphagus sediminis TaxID=3057113 RepID=UPI0025AF4477|nr:hypothetical protein [Algoriphagus sediminis]